MSHWEQARLVAAWEFFRYFKWKDQVIGLVFFVVISAVGYFAGQVMTRNRGQVTVAVRGIDLTPPAGSRVRVIEAPGDSVALAAQLEDGDVNGVLTRTTSGEFDLLVERDPRYLPELRALLAEVVMRERLAASGLSAAELGALLAPPALEVRYVDPDRERTGRGERLVAALFLGLVGLAVFTSMAYLLTGITGEKQLRVTESITAIIPPQAWIDGKILGIGGYALASLSTMVVGGILLAIVGSVAWGFTVPDVVARPAVILVLVAYSALALLLWNSVFAAFASTIDDPNTSTRTSMMFLPMLPLAMTFAVLRDPDGLLSRVLAVFPLTSPSAMPMRMTLSNPGVLEFAASVLLLVATVWLFRRLAGRIFEIGMLMYGKEPTLREMWRWASAPGRRSA